MRIRWFAWLILMLLLGACSRSSDPVDSPQGENEPLMITTTSIPTRTAFSTTTPSLTPTTTPTLTPTLTPTPTAPGIGVAGDPRAYTLFDPLSQPGAPCGWADTLDFPLDPPDGESVRGGDDFGSYRTRYYKYHAGEDWGLSNRNNFGKPVYSIGHGQVTYAQPLGWGPDKGVVIVRHTFPDGSSVFSFYGHLDPPSVILREGICLKRGDLVGQIGRPRTPPHLHFEIRTHLPYATGSGYWPSDPTDAGWLPPSQTISQYRLQVVPGALWTGESTINNPLGALDATTFLTIHDGSLVAVDLLSGEETWSYELTPHIKDALPDLTRRMLYISDANDGLLAYPIPTLDDHDPLPETLKPLWEQKLPSSGRMDLMPLPSGGVLVSYKDTLSAYSPQGEHLWDEEGDSYLVSWALAKDALLFTTFNKDEPLKSADRDGLYTWEENLSGIPLVTGDQVWFYSDNGLYRLDMADRTAQLVYDLPTAQMRRSTALPLSDGSILLLHTDTADRRLLAFDRDGELLWEFSIPLDGDPQLFELDGSVYLLIQPSFSGRGVYKTMEIFEVDLEGGKLRRIFESGSRTFNPRTTWAYAADGQKLIIHIAGVGSILFDPEAAQERMGR